MRPNPLLTRLGFSENDRAVIFHADDVGMCQASLAAYADLVDFGLISAASTMVPCSWFPATAAFCRSHPGLVDMGVHLTLTSEWEGYRWGPVSTRDPDSGLMDEAGYLHARSEAIEAEGDLDAVEREIEAQVVRAVAAGIDITHVDTHMGSVLHPNFLGGYIRIALQHGLPPLLLRLDGAGLQELGLDPETAVLFARQVGVLEAEGVPLLDSVQVMPLDQPDERVEQVKQTLDALPAGIHSLIVHPAQDTPELRAIAPDWRCRVADYRAFSSQALRDIVGDSGMQVLGWRVLRDLMRSGPYSPGT